MTRAARRLRSSGLLAAVAAALLLVPATASASFAIALQDQGIGQPGPAPSARNVASTMSAIGASTVRISVLWSQIAPNGSRKPAGFDARNPGDPHYTWSAVDAAVRAAASAHKHILLNLYSAPTWAQGPHRPNSSAILAGAWDPSASEFAAFAHAAAERYSGRYPDPLGVRARLPRVGEWEIWNEENLPWYLAAPHLIDEYRALLNRAYTAIKGVSAGNTVVLGGLAPVSFLPPRSQSPLTFATALLCLHRSGTSFARVKRCPHKARFDVFAHHPYSLAATPTKHAYRYNDVLVGDMQKVTALVHAADRLHTVAPGRAHRIWVTEFAWYTNPPNRPVGDSPRLAARYVAYSMYEMWRAGVSLICWYTLVDYPARYVNGTTVVTGAGLETSTGRRKQMMSAVGFPVIASVSHGRAYVWGRVPEARKLKVAVQRRQGHRWRRVFTVRSGADGVFQAHFEATGNGVYRAVVQHGPTSLAYDSRPIPPKRTHLFSSG